MLKSHILWLVICSLTSVLYSQSKLDFQIAGGVNVTSPKISYSNSIYRDKILDGVGKLGYTIEVSALKGFNNVKFGIKLANNLSRFGFTSNGLIFPDDASAGTHSSIETSISSFDLGLGALIQYYFNSETFYIQSGVDYVVEISSKGSQVIRFGFNPNLVTHNNDSDEIYSYKPGAVLNFSLGFRPNNNIISYKSGITYYLAKQNYNTFGWDINKLALNIALVINL